MAGVPRNGEVFDYCVVGGGIVGMATAMKLTEMHPAASVVVLEKEVGLGRHQTGHNSGVIHAGIYYQPGSLKAELCRRGAAATKAFCAEHGIPYEVCGKLLVATTALEAQRMAALVDRAKSNNIDVELLDGAELARREPHVRGIGALLVKSTGIVDFGSVTRAMGEVFRAAGGHVELNVKVTGIKESAAAVTISAGDRHWYARQLVVCAGLQADRMARMAGMEVDFRIVPFRGEYYRLPATKNDVVRHLIYPIPDPDLPFLGVHLTRMIDGGVTVGPNAVLGFAREGYRKLSVNPRDVMDYALFPGAWRMARKMVRTGTTEMRNSLWKRGYLRECRKYCPGLMLHDLLPSAAGIRAQAVTRDGQLVHDFLFRETGRMLHVCNAPSPAATSAIPIGEMIANRCMARLSRRGAPPS